MWFRKTPAAKYRYESQCGTSVINPTEEDLVKLLARLDGTTDSYASLTDAHGSYVQVGGGPQAFTAEEREILSKGKFCHRKAARSILDQEERRVMIGGANVLVKADEILDIDTVKQIFISFRNGTKSCQAVIWRDITSWFQK
ncbi:hypothetical protein [Planctomicrobium piriforme]|uniref:Uncharacterized protein n=1 Tax=Planctomicrobium piriforme TaxID=1576369 RepID=A0A1I3B0J4_9PLAN|nr:hypothetical protein [Planctomicrobium piriforme]SFH55191.1 hypothetical protein SAMN05421753_101129 [Planctomicrobium piriforme]